MRHKYPTYGRTSHRLDVLQMAFYDRARIEYRNFVDAQ